MKVSLGPMFSSLHQRHVEIMHEQSVGRVSITTKSSIMLLRASTSPGDFSMRTPRFHCTRTTARKTDNNRAVYPRKLARWPVRENASSATARGNMMHSPRACGSIRSPHNSVIDTASSIVFGKTQLAPGLTVQSSSARLRSNYVARSRKRRVSSFLNNT